MQAAQPVHPSLTAGSALNAGRQQPRGNCDPADPGRFVVTPALLLDGRLYSLQVVCTSSQAVDDLPGQG
jgi:hypothetical protein